MIEHAASSAAQRQWEWRTYVGLPVADGGSRLDGIAYEAAGGFCCGDQPRPHAAVSSRAHRAYAGRIAGRVGATVAPFLSFCPRRCGSSRLGCLVGAEVALAAWAPVFLAELARSGRLGVEVRVACGSSGGLTGPWIASAFWRGPCGPDRFVPGPTRVCPGRRSGRCGGLCRGVVLLGPGPRSVCVAPFASGPSLVPRPCVFEQYDDTSVVPGTVHVW